MQRYIAQPFFFLKIQFNPGLLRWVCVMAFWWIVILTTAQMIFVREGRGITDAQLAQCTTVRALCSYFLWKKVHLLQCTTPSSAPPKIAPFKKGSKIMSELFHLLKKKFSSDGLPLIIDLLTAFQRLFSAPRQKCALRRTRTYISILNEIQWNVRGN